MELTLYGYQEELANRIITNKRGVLTVKMGFGKTAIVLEAIRRMMVYNPNFRVLVVAPKRVAENVWSEEIEKWDSFKHITYAVIAGDMRMRKVLMDFKVNIQIVSRDNLDWFVSTKKNIAYDLVVFDELSSFKSYKSIRFKAAKHISQRVPRVIGLTGTPNANGYLDLWAQIYLIDGGERLGKFITKYRQQYFVPKKYVNGFPVAYYCLPEIQKVIGNKLSDIMWGLTDDSLLNLPELRVVDVKIKHPDSVTKAYKEFAKEKLMELKETTITALSGASLVNKLMQFSNGAIYTDASVARGNTTGTTDRSYEIVSSTKLDTLESLIEEAEGEPVLVAYTFRHDLQRIHARLSAKYKVGLYTDKDVVAKWNNKEYDVLLAHPASFGHGLNLQYGGSICIWYGPTYSLELYEQFNKRLHRPGQKDTVIIYRLISVGMIDEIIYYDSLKRKSEDMELLFNIISILSHEYDI